MDTCPTVWITLKIGSGPPGCPIDHRLHAIGQHPREIGRESAAGDVRQRVHLDGVDQREAARRIDPGRLKQLLAERAPELVDVPLQRPAGPLEEDVPDERIAVGMQS